MKFLSILGLFVWSTASIASGPPAGAPLKQLYESAQYEAFMPAAERLAATGDAEAQFLLAQAYHLGKGVNQDLSRAIDLYEKAARNGSWHAMSGLGDIMLREGGQPDRAAALFEGALRMGGSELASTKLTLAHWTLCMDEARGAACTRAAQAYQSEWERTRAEEPLEKALAALAANCEHAPRPNSGESGQLALPPATACAEAIALAERGAAAGNLPATHTRARLAAMRGDDQAVLAWLTRGADGGYIQSSEQLGALYAAGEGVPASQERAREWYEKAAAAGSRKAAAWLTDYWEEAARATADRDQVRQALDQLVRLNPEQERTAFDAAVRLDFLDAYAHNAEHGPMLKEPLARTICLPELDNGRALAWTIHALDGPDAGHGDTDERTGKARGQTGKSGCLRFGPEAARSIQAMFVRGATPLLEVAHQHYILVLGPAGSKVRALTAAPYPHVHTHGCGCGRHASNPTPIRHSET